MSFFPWKLRDFSLISLGEGELIEGSFKNDLLAVWWLVIPGMGNKPWWIVLKQGFNELVKMENGQNWI